LGTICIKIVCQTNSEESIGFKRSSSVIKEKNKFRGTKRQVAGFPMTQANQAQYSRTSTKREKRGDSRPERFIPTLENKEDLQSPANEKESKKRTGEVEGKEESSGTKKKGWGGKAVISQRSLGVHVVEGLKWELRPSRERETQKKKKKERKKKEAGGHLTYAGRGFSE